MKKFKPTFKIVLILQVCIKLCFEINLFNTYMFYELPVSNVGLPQRYVKKRSFFEDSKPKFNNVFAVRYSFIS